MATYINERLWVVGRSKLIADQRGAGALIDG